MRRLIAVAAVSVLAAACARAGDGAASPRPTESWRELAASPLPAGYGYEGVWTGRELIVWGGSIVGAETLESRPQNEGAAYDPKLDSWRDIPAAPLRGGSGYSVTWTGSEMVVWGDPTARDRPGNEGAAFDPATNLWRTIPDGPLPARSGHLAVWTGDEVVVWGGYLTEYDRERYDGRGAAFDPETDRWRLLPAAPLPAGYDAMGAWTGSEIIVLSTPMGIDPGDYPKFAEAAAYDPSGNSWRELPRPPFVASVSPPAVRLDDQLLFLSLGGTVDGGEVNGYGRSYPTGGIFDIRSEQWRVHADPPQRPNQTWEQTQMEDEVVIDGLAYDPARDLWRVLPEFPLAAREFPILAWTGDELIVWGGAARASGNLHVDPPPALNDGAAYTPAG